jgi:hypothetical protein
VISGARDPLNVKGVTNARCGSVRCNQKKVGQGRDTLNQFLNDAAYKGFGNLFKELIRNVARTFDEFQFRSLPRHPVTRTWSCRR